MSFSKPCLEMVRDLSQCHKIPLKTQKATIPKENCSKTLGQAKKLSFKILFKAYRLQKPCNLSLYLEGVVVNTKKGHFASSTSKAT